jgi:diacylglycerol kinase family enzyme
MPARRRRATLCPTAFDGRRSKLQTKPAPVSVSRRQPRSLRSLLLVVNGNASGSDRSRLAFVAGAALRQAGARPEVHVTSCSEELRAIWPDDPDRRVVLVGGDGTLHAAANLDLLQPEIAIIPAGAANNICRSVGIPLATRAAAALAVSGRVRPLDLIEARTAEARYLVTEGVSVGFLADARARYHGRNSADVLAALKAGAAALAAFHPLGVRVTSAGGSEELALAQLFVANLPLYAFGLQVAPHADPEDATLDLVGIEADDRLHLLAMLAELRHGTLLHHEGVHLWKAAAATLATHGASPVIADSTDLGRGPVSLRALPGALRLVRP